MRVPGASASVPDNNSGDITHFNFDGLDESALGFHPKYGPLVHKSKFYAWIGYDPTNATRTSSRHLDAKDLVKGVFSPIGQETRGGRRADALTVRGVRRILLRSDHPRALEYADKVLDILDELATKGMVVDEQHITDDQIQAGKERLDSLAQRRLEERMDYKSILHSLKLGGAVDDEYRMVQNTLYVQVFGMTATQLRATRTQLTGERRKDGEFTVASRGIAKNYLTEDDLKRLNSTVLATFAQIQVRYPHGTTAGQMVDAINRAASLVLGRAA